MEFDDVVYCQPKTFIHVFLCLCQKMSFNLNFINTSISRSSLQRSRLPSQSRHYEHLVNNLGNKANTKLLHFGTDISYVLFENPHIQEVTWIDQETSRSHMDSMLLKPEYNLIVNNQHLFSANTVKILTEKIAKHTIMCVLKSRHYDNQRVIERAFSRDDNISISSRLEIYDKDNYKGWKDGVIIYDIVKKE